MKIELCNLKEMDNDLQFEIRNWRNAKHVTKYFQIQHIDEETHKNWLKSLHEEKPNNIAFVIKVNGELVGLVYFLKIDYNNLTTDWGMYIYNQDLRGLGIGRQIVDWSIEYAKNVMGFKVIKLEVLKDNYAAIKLYEKCGFEQIGSKNDSVLSYKILLD